MRKYTAALLVPYRAPAIHRVLGAAAVADVGLWPVLPDGVGYVAPVTVPSHLERAIHADRSTLAQCVDAARLRRLWQYPITAPISPLAATMLAWLVAEACTFSGDERAQWRALRGMISGAAPPYARELLAVATTTADRYGTQSTVARLLAASAV